MTVTTKGPSLKKWTQRVPSKEALLTVGIFGEEADSSHGELTNVEIASRHEFGIGVPRRSFIRDPIDQWGAVIDAKLAKAGQQYLLGHAGLKRGVDLVGFWLVGELQENISRGIAPPNADRTIKLKGSSKPLIDTGQLRSSISHLTEVK